MENKFPRKAKITKKNTVKNSKKNTTKNSKERKLEKRDDKTSRKRKQNQFFEITCFNREIRPKFACIRRKKTISMTGVACVWHPYFD